MKKLLEVYPDLPSEVEEYFNRKKERENRTDLFGVTCLGKNLPNDLFGCKVCAFIGKSARGLKVHMKRTHKIVDEV